MPNEEAAVQHKGNFWKKSSNFFYIVIAFFINSLIWLAIWYYAGNKGDFLPLHYNTQLGIDRIGPWYELFYMPGAGLLFIIVNYLLAWRSWKETALSDILLIGTIIIQLIIGIAVAFIIYQFL
ncbi:MAG: hypothetical protein V1853_02950 [bacterium]